MNKNKLLNKLFILYSQQYQPMTDMVLKCYASFIQASIFASFRVIGFVFLEQIQGLYMHLQCIVCLTTTESCYLIVVHINCHHIRKVLGMIHVFLLLY